MPILNKSANTNGMLSHSSRSNNSGRNTSTTAPANAYPKLDSSTKVVIESSGEGGANGIRHNETIHELIAEEALSDRLTQTNESRRIMGAEQKAQLLRMSRTHDYAAGQHSSDFK